jgi:hypothetical protein
MRWISVRAIAYGLVGALLFAACSADDGTDGTEAPEATTADGEVSTTVATGSTPPGESTTTTQPYVWADLPLVTYADWGGMALGWWEGSEWVQVSEDTTLPISGDEAYQVALLGADAIVEGGPQHNLGCEVVGAARPGVELSDGEALSTRIDDGQGGERLISGVAVSAPWDIHPRPTVSGDTIPDLENAAFDLLADLGFTTDSVSIVQVLETDLDGDGDPETVVVAESTELANQASGVYSMVFATSASWNEPAIVAESVIPATEEGFPESYRVSAVADLNGDEVMEIVISGEAWENSWVGVYELTPDGFVATIGAGCGV